jgi:thiol:disulfide interchange protein DsbG
MNNPKLKRTVVHLVLTCAAVVSSQAQAQPLPPAFENTRVVDMADWAQMKSLRGIAVGPVKAGDLPNAYVFFDVNCPHCAELWVAKVGAKNFNEVPMVWVPVTFMSKTSLNKAAHVLRQNNVAGLAQNFEQFNHNARLGAAPEAEPTDAERLALKRSTDLWKKLGGGTPMMVYRAKTGQIEKAMGVLPEPFLENMVNRMGSATLSTYP